MRFVKGFECSIIGPADMILTFMIASIVRKGISDFLDRLVAWAAGVISARYSVNRLKEGRR